MISSLTNERCVCVSSKSQLLTRWPVDPRFHVPVDAITWIDERTVSVQPDRVKIDSAPQYQADVMKSGLSHRSFFTLWLYAVLRGQHGSAENDSGIKTYLVLRSPKGTFTSDVVSGFHESINSLTNAVALVR